MGESRGGWTVILKHPAYFHSFSVSVFFFKLSDSRESLHHRTLIVSFFCARHSYSSLFVDVENSVISMHYLRNGASAAGEDNR